MRRISKGRQIDRRRDRVKKEEEEEEEEEQTERDIQTETRKSKEDMRVQKRNNDDCSGWPFRIHGPEGPLLFVVAV